MVAEGTTLNKSCSLNKYQNLLVVVCIWGFDNNIYSKIASLFCL